MRIPRDKLFLGPKIRALREREALSLEVCADRLGLPPSYLSQIETNQRPVTARVLIALTRGLGVDPADFDADDESRLIAELKEASADLALGATPPTLAQIKLAAATTPDLARQFLALHRAYRSLDQRLKTLDENLTLHSPEAAEALAEALGIGLGTSPVVLLETALDQRHGFASYAASPRPATCCAASTPPRAR